MLSLNVQPAEKPVKGDGKTLEVVEVFKTIQGEGPFAGHPAVFVRLAGCDLCCPGCDTQYTQNRRTHDTIILTEYVRYLATDMRADLVVITGGEPFRQPIARFCHELLDRSLIVQIETNGTLAPQDSDPHSFPFNSVHIVCSPKTPKIHPRIAKELDSLKYVVRAGEIDESDGLPTKTLGNEYGVARPTRSKRLVPVYVQPLDEGDNAVQNALNTQAAIKSCMEHGHIFCAQIHKLVGLP
jgi:7-carboxy-7-deazaguanine synthase